MKTLKDNGFRSMTKKASKMDRKPRSWDYELREDFDCEKEMREAFTMMTNEQLRYHATLFGKNKEYAEALLKHRSKK